MNFPGHSYLTQIIVRIALKNTYLCKESVKHERNNETNDLNKWKTTNVRIISHRTLHLGQSLKMCKYYYRKHTLTHFLTKNMPYVAGVL